jgi:hypothetical protein
MVKNNTCSAIINYDFTLAQNTNFFADQRVKRCWFIPRPQFKLGENPPNLEASSSFIGGDCYSCFPSRRKHSINGKSRLIILGDQFIPPVVGAKGDCCLVLRVNQGNFNEMKDLIFFQISQGFKFSNGSVVCIFLLSHLLRIGENKYWQDLSRFMEWLRHTFKVTVLPGIPPYPAGLEPAQLVTISQYFHHLLGANSGKGRVGGNNSCILWKPFHLTAKEFKTASTQVVVPPMEVREAKCMMYPEQVFCSGFEGDWSTQMPCTIQTTFFNNLFVALADFNLPLPPLSVLQTNIITNPLQGKTLFLAGTSILEGTANSIIRMADEKGVKVVSAFKKGDFIKHFKELDLSKFKEGSREDVCVLSFLGNYLLNKDDVVYTHDQHTHTCHLLNPSIPCDITMGKLVIDVGRIIRTFTQIFPGRIYLLGPLYRHLVPCCNLEEHMLRGPHNEEINMMLYTKAFSQFLHASPGIVQDRVIFIHPHEIYLNDFNSTSLCDGVHLNGEATDTLANFTIKLLNNKRRFRTPVITNEDFFSYLAGREVINSEMDTSNKLDDDDDQDMTGAIDQCIELSGNIQ